MTYTDPVKQALAELQDLVRCRCHEAYKGRGLHDPNCHCDSADAVKAVADDLETLDKACKEWVDVSQQNYQRAKVAEAKLAKAVEALTSVIDACDQGRMIPRPGHGAGGMTIEANVKGSIYTGVPAWPIEEARTTLAELNGGKP